MLPMLREEYQELLSAYVDGELSDGDHQAVERLLKRSAEARVRLRELQEDADLLRNLPRYPFPAEAERQLLRCVATLPLPRLLSPLPAPPPARREFRLPFWAAVPAAAAVFFLVGSGAFVYFLHTAPEGQAALEGDVATGPVVEEERRVSKLPEPGGAVTDRKPVDRGGRKAFEVIEGSGQLAFDLHHLEAEQLRGELRKGGAFRLELSYRQGAQALSRLAEVLKNGKTDVFGATAGRSSCAIYLEDVTPDELVALMTRLAEVDKPGDGYFNRLVVRGLTTADRDYLKNLLRADLAQAPGGAADDPALARGDAAHPLVRLLGGWNPPGGSGARGSPPPPPKPPQGARQGPPPNKTPPPPAKKPVPNSGKKPAPGGNPALPSKGNPTAPQIGPGARGPLTPAPKGPDTKGLGPGTQANAPAQVNTVPHQALLFTFDSGQPQQASQAVKDYLSKRGKSRPNTLKVVFLLREDAGR
jgi:hypothetical protein